jgi:hypothetical protein
MKTAVFPAKATFGEYDLRNGRAIFQKKLNPTF